MQLSSISAAYFQIEGGLPCLSRSVLCERLFEPKITFAYTPETQVAGCYVGRNLPLSRKIHRHQTVVSSKTILYFLPYSISSWIQ